MRIDHVLFFFTFLLIPLLNLYSSLSFAQNSEEILLLQLSGNEELVSIATGTPRLVSKAPAVTTVITAAEIESSGANTFKELLERVPGLHVITSKAKVQSPTYAIRGINTSQGPHTLILVNGVAITYLLTGSLPSGFQVPLAGIKRIEIIRGPGSAVYGADAFSGVINIISKTNKDINGSRVGVKAGSFNTRTIWGQYANEYSTGWNTTANIEFAKSDGDRDRIIDSDLQTILDAKYSTSASNAPGAMNTQYESLTTNLTLSKNNWTSHFNSWNRKLGTGAGFANVLDPTGFTRHDQYLFAISHEDKNWQPNLSIKTRLSYLYLNSKARLNIFPKGSILPISSDGNYDPVAPAGTVLFTDGYIGNPGRTEKTTNLDITSIYRGWKQQLWRFNFGTKKEISNGSSTQNFGPGVIDGTVSPIDGTLSDISGATSVYIPNSNRTVSYVSIQNEWHFVTDWNLTAGLRYDDYSDFGGTTNPRLSLVWDTRHNLTTKLLYGRAFRAPSFAELYSQNNPVLTGNSKLDPETINTYELVFDYRSTTSLSAVLNIFQYNAKGIIEFVDDDGIAGGSATAQNSKDQHAEGFELALKWQPTSKLNLIGSYAQNNAHDMQTKAYVADTPRKQIHFIGNWKFHSHWTTSIDTYRVMDRARPSNDSREKIDDYTWVNATLHGNNFINEWDITISVRNLFDTDAREPAPIEIKNDYPLEGRSVYFSISTEI